MKWILLDDTCGTLHKHPLQSSKWWCLIQTKGQYVPGKLIVSTQHYILLLIKLLMFVTRLKLPMCACRGLLIFISAALLGFTGV